MISPLCGIVPPLVTPLSARDTLDVSGLERLLEHVIGGGVHGLFILGTTGEGPSLSYRLRRELIERTCRQTAGRVPVLVGITDTAPVESVALARHAAERGASAVVLAPPYYLHVAQAELREYVGHLLEQLPLPLMLYNMPALTKVTYELPTVTWAMQQPRIVGIKDSSGNMLYFQRLCGLAQQRSDWSVLIGPEELLPCAVAAGGHGGVNGGANMFPALYTALYNAAHSGDAPRTKELWSVVLRVSETIYGVGQYASAGIKGIKCVLSCLGVCNDFLEEPFHAFRQYERTRIEQHLAELLPAIRSALGAPAA
jgi:4-hydroxy-tetrahydrodipicolinate synthase